MNYCVTQFAFALDLPVTRSPDKVLSIFSSLKPRFPRPLANGPIRSALTFRRTRRHLGEVMVRRRIRQTNNNNRNSDSCESRQIVDGIAETASQKIRRLLLSELAQKCCVIRLQNIAV